MAEDESGSAARPHRRRRLYFHFLAGAPLLVLVAAYFFLPELVRPLIEHTLAERVHAPVHIARLSWRPFVGEVTAQGIAVGTDGGRLSAGRLSVDIALDRLLHREIVFDQLVLDRPVTTVELDDRYRPTLAGSSPNTGAGGATAALPPLTVHRLV